MKRDMNLIRHLLAYIEEQPPGEFIQKVSVPNEITGPTLGEHLRLLIEHDLIEGEVFDVGEPMFMIRGLTWEGHDFLQTVQNETVWRKITAKAKELGGSMTLEIAKELGKKYLADLAGL